MPETNLDYLYEHLPSRMRRDDEGRFLKRFLTPACEELDSFDEKLDTFYQKIAPETSPVEFIEWWLWSLFGWGWFPPWFTLSLKRAFYSHIARHYARRGTVRGITEFLADFGVRAIVEATPLAYGEFAWGENIFEISGPLGIVVRIFPEAAALPADLSFWGAFVVGESALAEPGNNLQVVDVDELLRFQQPLGQIIMIEYLQFPSPPPIDITILTDESGDALKDEGGQILHSES